MQNLIINKCCFSITIRSVDMLFQSKPGHYNETKYNLCVEVYSLQARSISTLSQYVCISHTGTVNICLMWSFLVTGIPDIVCIQHQTKEVEFILCINYSHTPVFNKYNVEPICMCCICI